MSTIYDEIRLRLDYDKDFQALWHTKINGIQVKRFLAGTYEFITQPTEIADLKAWKEPSIDPIKNFMSEVPQFLSVSARNNLKSDISAVDSAKVEETIRQFTAFMRNYLITMVCFSMIIMNLADSDKRFGNHGMFKLGKMSRLFPDVVSVKDTFVMSFELLATINGEADMPEVMLSFPFRDFAIDIEPDKFINKLTFKMWLNTSVSVKKPAQAYLPLAKCNYQRINYFITEYCALNNFN